MYFFLEGPIQIGKSTLLRQTLLPCQHRVAGMMVQRLFEGGERCGYRACVVRGALPELEAPYTPALDNVFLYKGASRPEILDGAIEGALEAAGGAGYPLILLDEIGGAELLSARFMAALGEILRLGKPCCGVLKSAENLTRTARGLGLPPEICGRGETLRQTLQSGGTLLSVKPGGLEAARAPLLAFVQKALGPAGG